MKYNNNNIISSFFKRAIFSIVFLGIASSSLTIYIQKYNFYNSLKNNLALDVNIALKTYDMNRDILSQEHLKEHLNMIMKSAHFLSVEVYDKNQHKFFELIQKDEKYINEIKLMKRYNEFSSYKFQISNEIQHKYFEIEHKHYFLQIFYPIYNKNQLLGYIEGTQYIDPKLIHKFKNKVFIMILIIIGTILLFSLIIFPLIYLSYQKLNQKQIELLSSNLMTLNTLGNTIALRDSDTSEHNYRVTLYSIKLAIAINLNDENIKKIIVGAFLHDIGKIGIPDNILLKNGKLTDEEFIIMKEHVIKGVQIIQDNPWLENAKDVILYHHEKYDGTGYPNGLKGKNIPLIARIFAIIDVFDALTSQRPYKKAFSYNKAIEILKENSGTHFDKELLQSFINISEELYNSVTTKTQVELKEELKDLTKKYFFITLKD